MIRIIAVTLALAGCGRTNANAPAGAIRVPGFDRLYCVASDTDGCHLYRSAQPEDDGRLPVDVVIKLNSSLEHHEVLGSGQEIYQHPWLPAGPVLHPETEQALDDLDAALAAGKRVLVHCTEGRDRTGLLVALWRVRHGSLPAAAFGEWVSFGSHRFHWLEEAFERETGWTP